MLDKSKIYVIDDVASIAEANFTEEQFTNNNTLWEYNKNTVWDGIENKDVNFNSKSLNKICRGGQFVHMIMHESKKEIRSPHVRVGILILQNLANKLGFNIDKVLRVKVNFNLKEDTRMIDSCYTPHCDQLTSDFWTAIYYVDDNDGDTIIFNEINQTREYKDYTFPGEFSIRKRVEAKKGRVLLFNGDYYHAGTPPINSNKRIVINYNFTIKS